MTNILFGLLISVVVGLFVRLLIPGRKNLSDFAVAAILGVLGTIFVSLFGYAIGWYAAGEGTGLIGSLLGSAILIALWESVARRHPSRQLEVESDERLLRREEPPLTSPIPPNDVVAELEKLAALRNSGAIDDGEFSRMKARLLNSRS